MIIDNALFLLLILGHILGDFYLQTEKMSKLKMDNVKSLTLHSFLYFISISFCLIPIISIKIFMIGMIISVIHLLIDSVKYLLEKRYKVETLHNLITLLFDQGIHFISILMVLIIFWQNGINTYKVIGIISYLDWFFEINKLDIIKFAIITLAVYKPINIIFIKVYKKYKPNIEDVETIRQVGANIGGLERILIIVLLYLNQFAAIGLVLTAKSIARYNKIAEDPKFAEYYLLGTLFSVLSAICIFYLFA